MKREFLRQAIHRGLGFLSANQVPSGEFPGLASFEPAMGSCISDSAVFPTALILHSLELVLDSRDDPMRSKAYRFLEEEMIGPGLWRYWTDHSIWQQWRGSGESIAPDVDCTCCASFVLRRRQPEASLFSNIETILDNRNQDGLFLTWIRSSGDINDVDSVVNANVLLYLGESPETRAVVDYLNRIGVQRDSVLVDTTQPWPFLRFRNQRPERDRTSRTASCVLFRL